MRFDFQTPNPGIWFFFDESNPEKGKICLRHLNDSKRREIQKQIKKNPPKRNQLFAMPDKDEILESRLTWDYCITDWENVQDEHGNDIPCNIDTKSSLMDNSPYFSEIVLALLKKLDEEYEERRAGELPN
jgi:hypothetical protein